MTPSRNAVASTLFTVLAALALTLSVAVHYVDRAVFDSEQFADRATTTLQDERVRSLIAEEITDRVVLSRNADLVAARPLIESATAGVVASRSFGRLLGAGVRDAHRAVFDADANTMTVTVADIGTVIGAALRKLDPAAAGQVRRTHDVEILHRDVGGVTGRLARLADGVHRLWLWLLVLAGLLAAAAVVLAADRRRGAARLAVGVLVGGTAIVALCTAGRAIALGAADSGDARAVTGAVWDAYVAGLANTGLVLAVCGAVLLAAATYTVESLRMTERAQRVARAIAGEPASRRARVARAAGLIVAGALIVADPSGAARLAFTLLGVLVVCSGVDAVLRLANATGSTRVAASDEAARRPVLTRVGLPVLLALLAAVAATTFFGSDESMQAGPRVGACNGSAALCSRSLPEVALAATHNSMSVPLPGWYSSEQDRPISQQLADGVRGLLIDTHYADKLDNGRVRTVLHAGAPGRGDDVSAEAVAAAMRLRERVGFRGAGKRGMYLCHSFCELGATRLDAVLEDLHEFLLAHPEEVVVVINQDEVTPADFVGALHAAGLDRLAFTPPTDGRWPTLGAMIRSDRRLVVLAEHEAGAAAWYRPVYDGLVQETPYAFKSARELTGSDGLRATCRPHRGGTRAPLLLLNHWVTTDPLPRPSDAERVNAEQVLLKRAQLCARIRGRLANLVAVNYYRRGDLMRVVDRLNGVRR